MLVLNQNQAARIAADALERFDRQPGASRTSAEQWHSLSFWRKGEGLFAMA
jgi:hypothetical protein